MWPLGIICYRVPQQLSFPKLFLSHLMGFYPHQALTGLQRTSIQISEALSYCSSSHSGHPTLPVLDTLASQNFSLLFNSEGMDWVWELPQTESVGHGRPHLKDSLFLGITVCFSLVPDVWNSCFLYFSLFLGLCFLCFFLGGGRWEEEGGFWTVFILHSPIQKSAYCFKSYSWVNITRLILLIL